MSKRKVNELAVIPVYFGMKDMPLYELIMSVSSKTKVPASAIIRQVINDYRDEIFSIADRKKQRMQSV